MSRDAIRNALQTKLAPVWIDPPVLQPAAIYLELSGEDIRRRAFLAGDDLCLRPDMTAPAVRAAFAMQTPPPVIAYEGVVFRQQQSGSSRETEFVQIGAEWIGAVPLTPANEAEIIALALQASGNAATRMKIGDVGIRSAFVAACGLDPRWAARTIAALERPNGLDALAYEIAHLPEDAGAGLAEALASLTPEHAEAALADILDHAGITNVGQRPVGEIAQRLRERGALAAAAPPSEDQRALLAQLIAIDAPDGLAQARVLAKSPALKNAKLAVAAIEAAEARATALGKPSGMPRDVTFAPGLGRAVAYYDGFVFELEAAKLGDRASLGGGGRYDGLARALWPKEKGAPPAGLRAAGFALRPDRLAEAAR